MAKESISDMFSEDNYFSAGLLNEDDHHHVQLNNQTFEVSDSKYAEMLQLQDSIMASIISSQNPNNTSPLLTIGDTPSSSSNPKSTEIGKEIGDTPSSSNPKPMEIGKEIGESSHNFCEICVEKKQNDEMFRVQRCSHFFCSDCISKHVAVKIQDNLSSAVSCPGLDCDGVLELDTCKAVIPKEVSDRWDEALTESLILASQKFYCPFKDCSAVLVNDTTEVIRESECPECRRLFCAQCHSPWHSGIKCEEFQKLNVDERGREDLMVRELAKSKNWARCPHCKFYVEKAQGCLHITCRCKFEFCYACGAKWSLIHLCRWRPS